MKFYVLGFLIWTDRVALIHKLKGPKPVLNRLNGIGGAIEENESPWDAMVREFNEEAGLIITTWHQYARLEVREYYATIFCFSYRWRGDSAPAIKSMTEEQVAWYKIDEIHQWPIVPNLKWLIPLAVDPDDLVANITDLTRSAL